MSMNEDVVSPVPGIENLTYEDVNTLLNIQRLWLEVIQWMRAFFHGVLENSPAQSAAGTRLFQKLPMDLYNEFKKYYSEEESRQFLNIITRLISGNWQLITSYQSNDKASIATSTAQWYQTANELSEFLASINKYYDETQFKTLFDEYINLKTAEINAIVKR